MNTASISRFGIVDVASPDGGRTVVAVDEEGVLSRRGANGIFQGGGATATPTVALAGVGGDRVVAVGWAGISVWRNDESEARPVAARLRRGESLSGADPAGAAVFAFGPHTLLRSGGGARWVRVALPDRRDPLVAVDFVDRRSGYVITAGGRLFGTRDGGQSWIESLSTGRVGADLAFTDRLHGFVIAGSYPRFPGVVMRTDDGGRSWRPQIVSPQTVSALDSAGLTVYLLSPPAALYATRTDGDGRPGSRLEMTVGARRVTRGRSVTVSGRLTPPAGRTEVAISRRTGSTWVSRVVGMKPDGSFTSAWRVPRNAIFVAHALGSASHAGAGSQARFVRVVRR
jgi:hypothetical protein